MFSTIVSKVRQLKKSHKYFFSSIMSYCVLFILAPTAFKFTATLNTTGPALNATLSCTKKTTFDLKASLSRPITWKVHKGKLKPLTDVSEPKYLYTEIASKTPKTQSR